MSNKMGRKNKRNLAISNVIFAAAVIILIIAAAVGFGLYLTKPPTTVTKTITSISTITTPPTTVTSTVTTTQTQTVTKTVPVIVNSSGAFLNGNVITFMYTAQFSCPPVNSSFYPNSTVESEVMGCEVGLPLNSSAMPANAAPVYVVVPAFAGLSIFGPTALGATPQGFPVFHYNGYNYTILTQCGAADTPTACPDHMSLIYSPAFTTVEQYLGIKNGVFGLPEGVLPTPAHEHIVTFSTNTSIPWYIVVVLDFNPNIYPNPITGQCSDIVQSNSSDPTGLCLNSYANLEAALSTHDTAVMAANSNNPIWIALGKPSVDAIAVPSNMILYFSDPDIYPYPI
ncbi:hypothetical protein [Acidianus brierleyi]|nr:hypothetical protein [Acidianus brierleyi]